MASVLQLVPWLSLVVVVISAQGSFKTAELKPQCLGNIVRLIIDKSFAIGGYLEVDAVNGSSYYPITPSMAPRCGYRKVSDPQGNAKLFASILSCYTRNKDDKVFDMKVRLKINKDPKSTKPDMYEASRTCKYSQWADREVLCDQAYMEVSVNRLIPLIDPTGTLHGEEDQWASAVIESVTSQKNIWRMVFYTPKEKSMLLTDAQRLGYYVATTSRRLIVRSQLNATESYTENVAGVSMNVLKVTTYFKNLWSVTMLNSAAACPNTGLDFTEEMITWTVPRCIHPLLASNNCETLMVGMGIDGEQLNEAQMASRGYTMSVTDSHVIIELPVGGPDGYYKSSVRQNRYHISYSIEAMIEMMWKEADFGQLTRYKVLYPITTPIMPKPPYVFNNTVPGERVFDLVLGPFLYDVMLVNITFATSVLTVTEAKARGFNVQEHHFSNGSKTFSLQVPFTDPVVLKSNSQQKVTIYTLRLIFGLVVLPEQSPFSHTAALEARLQNVVLPVVTGTCDEERYYISVTYGSYGKDLKYIIGKRELTAGLAKEYNVHENATHMTMRVSFLSTDAVFTFVIPAAAGGRLDFKVTDPRNKQRLNDFSLACTFPMSLTECHSNGTMTSLALKVESVPYLIPSQLTLIDRSCKPVFSNSQFASFSFPVNSCGTVRLFSDKFIIYQNRITMPYQGGEQKGKPSSQPEYRLTITCYYIKNEVKTIRFLPKARSYDLIPKISYGEMRIRMRMATDGSFRTFYVKEDYPVVEYLRRPLYFEVELMNSTDPELELFLERCWATLSEDGLSTPRWDIITDGCPNQDDRYMATMHLVTVDKRIQFPSHFKHFDMKMFAFVQDNAVLKNQIYVRCDVAICDRNRQSDGLCYRQCSSYPGIVDHEGGGSSNSVKSGLGNAEFSPKATAHLSSGRILVFQ